jgi:hypothetical protein
MSLSRHVSEQYSRLIPTPSAATRQIAQSIKWIFRNSYAVTSISLVHRLHFAYLCSTTGTGGRGSRETKICLSLSLVELSFLE